MRSLPFVPIVGLMKGPPLCSLIHGQQLKVDCPFARMNKSQINSKNENITPFIMTSD